MNAPYEAWPALTVDSWIDTRDTVHLWTQIVGKTIMALGPAINHWWGVPLYVDARGLTTSLMSANGRGLEIRFDFLAHELQFLVTDGTSRRMTLAPRTVADFYREYRTHLRDLGFEIDIVGTPVELPDATPFAEDTTHASYDAEAMAKFWRSLVSAHGVFSAFRGDFRGKSSPVHFFWGAFDLAVTRFSGRPAPQHPGGVPNCPDWVMHEAYSDEVSSAGYWPGGAEEGLLLLRLPAPGGVRHPSRRRSTCALGHRPRRMGASLSPRSAIVGPGGNAQEVLGTDPPSRCRNSPMGRDRLAAGSSSGHGSTLRARCRSCVRTGVLHICLTAAMLVRCPL